MSIIKVIVKTNAKKNEILGFDKEKAAFVVSVKAPPEKGRANIEVIKIFSKEYKQPVSLVSGFKSKVKLLQIG